MSNIDLHQISSEDNKTGSSNIRIKLVLFIYCPWKKGILKCINSAAICCNIPFIPSVL